jgi:predicted dinucleotide-binding enzyme
MSPTRRLFLGSSLAAGLVPTSLLATTVGPAVFKHEIARTSAPLKIGVIGSGRVGGVLGELWDRAGHDVMFSNRTPEDAQALARKLDARWGTPAEAAAFGDVVLLTVPMSAVPEVARELGPILRGKIMLETVNPGGARDTPLAQAALAKGTGVAMAEQFPGVKVVRGFTVIPWVFMAGEANRPGEKAGIMLASDDPDALAMGQRLARDIGFDPVVVGGMATTRRFEYGMPTSGVHTAAELRSMLDLR